MAKRSISMLKESENENELKEEILEPVSNIFKEEWINFCKAGKRDKSIIMNNLARNIAHTTLNKIGYTFEFEPAPLDDLLEIFNIRVVNDPSLDDALLIKEKDGWTIKLNNNRPEERKKFSLAHEIAHFLLKDVVKRYPRLLRLEELFCDKIASELLAPSKMFEINDVDSVLSKILSDKKSILKIFNIVEWEHLEELIAYIKGEADKRLNLALFEAMRKHLVVSRPMLVRKLHHTKLLNDLMSGAIICFEGASGLRVIYRATPTWMYIPKGIRCEEIGLPSSFDFEQMDIIQIKFKEKVNGKWIDSCEEFRVYYQIYPWGSNSKYLLILFRYL